MKEFKNAISLRGPWVKTSVTKVKVISNQSKVAIGYTIESE